MDRNFKEAIINRRSNYSISNKSPISDKEIEDILKTAILHVPSAFNSQSTRIVLLLGENHKKLWDITKKTLKEIISSESYSKTEDKINSSFSSGYGTVLFYEDYNVIEELQKRTPTYHEQFPRWSEHTSAMHQFVVWTMLSDAGFGASLQHYNPLIDEEVAETWDIEPNWHLIAQMPFGEIIDPAGEKEFEPMESRLLVF